MKKLTATIFASLLTVVSVGAASANIASQGYVDDQVKTRVATETYSAEIGEVSQANMGTTTATTVVGGIKEAMTQANANALAIENLPGEGTGSINAALDEIEAGYQAADKEITDTIGEVPEGKTVVDMIDDAVKAGAYDDTELSGKIGTLEGAVNNETTGLAATKGIADANKTAIETLNGDAETAGSVAKAVKDAVDQVSTKATDNASAIAKLNGDDETEGSGDYKIKAAQDSLTTTIDGKQVKSTAI